MSNQERRGLAFYKRSGEPWTKEEYLKICEYCGDTDPGHSYPTDTRPIYDDGSIKAFMFNWSDYWFGSPDQCKKVYYEDIFSPIWCE